MVMFALASIYALFCAIPAQADLGDEVVNIARISQDTPTGRLEFETNAAIFIIEARDTPSQVDFFRIAPNAPDAQAIKLNGSDYSPTGETDGPFEPITNIAAFGGGAIFDTSNPRLLVPADTYVSGEVMIVRVTDIGQNGDPNKIETVIITVTTSDGDTITLRLYEDAPNSGQFFAYFPSTRDTTPSDDITITATQNTVLTATYIDAFNATEVSVDTALVDPLARVFDSFTGRLIDGVPVTLINADTGAPATVYGIDGTASYPATVIAGEAVTDSNGIVYPAQSGVFFFPMLLPGNYQLVVDAPENYIFASVRDTTDFAALSNAPFTINPDGSYGQRFTVKATGPLHLDIPLDPNGELVARKSASVQTASIGDFIGYTVELDNGGDVPAPFNVRDTLPRGMRYVAESARLNGALSPEPQINANGRTLTFTGGLVMPGESQQLTYLVSVGPGTQKGTRVNTATAINTNGEAISNIAEAAVQIEEDLLTSRLIIAGRIAEAACKPEAEWARALEDGTGIAGVRLYMEDGRYVVTDEDGLYHFEDVAPGTHVVQVDRATLPKGYEPVICEENSRYAGSALSKFVDAKGGSIWRANFYLKRNGDDVEAQTQGRRSYSDEQMFGKFWLETQNDPTPRWVYPRLESTPDGRSINLGFSHAPDQAIEMRLNGKNVSALNFSGIDVSGSSKIAISRWNGVDIQRGRNTLIAIVRDSLGSEVGRHTREVWFVDEPERARLVIDQSTLIADGRTPPSIALRLEDAAGNAVHEGRLVNITVTEPYRLASEADAEFEAPIAALSGANTATAVGAGGLAHVKLEPTLRAGRIRLRVQLGDDRFEDIEAWLQPEKREWILVGLAEAEGMLVNADGDASREVDEVMTDGRLAFFAKGMIKGDWLLTVAVDTAKRRGSNNDEIFDRIDPNAYYTLYGDRTFQENDAESRYPVYVKLEKDMFQAVFGDYNTDLTDTQLGRYSRRLSGLKTAYESDRLSVTAFAAESDQSFVKDEIAADGTSGPFRLRNAPLIRSSEILTIETRDRFRPDVLVNVQTLQRYTDYEIDYVTGEIFFRSPIAATDSGFNPNVIVADYETEASGERTITAGGRIAARFAGGALETGLTVIHEEDGNGENTGPSDLIGVDATLRLNDKTEIIAEYAESQSNTSEGDTNGSALLIEATRRDDNYSVTGYYRSESADFGIGQQSSSTSALQRIGAQLSAELNVSDIANSNDRSVRSLNAQVYREENLSSETSRNVADIALIQDAQALSASVGLRAASETFEGDPDARQSVLITGSVRKTFADAGLTLTAAHEEPVYAGGASDDEVTLFPQRTILGVDKTLGNRATLSVRHEITNGENASGENTVAGISWIPRGGTQVRASTDVITSDGARRVGATVGVDQTWRISDRWSMGAGLARRANIDGDDAPLDPTADIAISPLEDGVRSDLTGSESYTAAYLGAAYQTESTAGSLRTEMRDSTQGQRYVTTFGGAREVSQRLSFSAAARHQKENLTDTPDTERFDMRVGAAWRSKGEGLILLNRTDIGTDEVSSESRRTKAVNNLTLNTMLTDRTQLAVYHGIKYVETEFGGATASGFTNLFGSEVRHDLTERIDLGLHGTWTSGEATGTDAWSFGPSIGFTPKKNVWISVGYNAQGFTDEDFQAAEYTAQGPYIKLRAKFDQDSVRDLFQDLGLGAK
jgi:uncharacterized repeat protein (TIGR01451 family)